MNNELLLDRLFGLGSHHVVVEGSFLSGTAVAGGHSVAIIGTCPNVAVDSELVLKIAGAILNTVRDDINAKTTSRPIVLLVDTQGHKLSRHEELIGLNGYFAHMARCVDLAHRQGHRIISVIHGKAVSACFLAFGMIADRICALPDVEMLVMDLHAMARVTKIDYNKLLSLVDESPVFAPGAENYWRMGAVHELWKADSDWHNCLIAALTVENTQTSRSVLGMDRGGRQLAALIAKLVAAP